MEYSLKRKKLEEIKDEINEFHPLLNELLTKLTNIRHVDYTHGVGEKGADFVLHQYNDQFQTTDYVGVIAKIGKIHMDFTDVERQIDECCSLERYVEGGRKKIQLTEIWVISNSTITANAEEKINNKFKANKIRFIKGQTLSELIDKHLPNYWYDISLKLGLYLAEIKYRNEELDKTLNLLPTCSNKIYIEQDITERENEYTSQKHKNSYIDIYKAITQKKIIIIEGGMGSGKSKLLRQIVCKYSNGEAYIDEKIIPLFCTYTDFVDKYEANINKLIENQIAREIIDNLGEDSNILLLIDGIDEKDLPVEQNIEILKRITKDIYEKKNVKAVFASRQLNSIEAEKEITQRVVLYELKSLSMTRVVEFLNAICREINISCRIIEDLKNSVLFKELPRSPIAAILLANLINENSKDLPANMTELFNKYIELMLGRWDIQKGLQSQKEYEASENILMDLSVYMIENSLPVLSNVEFQDRISGYLNQRNMEIEPSMLYDKIVNRSGLLVNDVDKHVIYFKHRTFMEFLYAKKCSKGKILDIDTRAFNYYWQNIYYFYVGLNKDCPAILQQIIDVVPVNEPQKWFRLSNVGNYLMAGYSSPYQIVQDNLYKIFIEASILYQDIVASKIKSPFSNVSQIYLFWFITIVLKNSYAYEYFQKSLEDTNILIDDNTQKDAQVKSFALFFAAVIAHELEMEKPFDFMISNYKDEIPLPVGFGILYETKDYDKSEAIKKYLKKMKRNVKMSKSLNDSMMVLHQRPIKQLKIT